MTSSEQSDLDVTWRVSAATVIAWLGLVVHNVADLPGQTLLSPETLWPSVAYAVLLIGFATGARLIAAVGLVLWSSLNVLGAALTVLPLAFLPFDPEQTLRHYSFHVLYLATQIPLLVVSSRLTIRGFRLVKSPTR